MYSVSGYPAPKTFKSYLSHKKYEQGMFDMEGLLNSWIISTFIMTLITSGGESGSSLWNEMNGVICCYGTHTQGFDGKISNRGVKITEETLVFYMNI